MLTFRMQKKNRKKGGIIFNRKKNMGLWGTLIRLSRYDNVTLSPLLLQRRLRFGPI